jgi:hypothetical protein
LSRLGLVSWQTARQIIARSLWRRWHQRVTNDSSNEQHGALDTQ